MKKLLLFLSVVVIHTTVSAQIFLAESCEVSFFSETPVENINAVNKSSRPLINTSTNEVQIKIANTGFVFVKPLMQEHFNENYMESEKFPYSIFKGKINDSIDWKKDGEYTVTVTGMMSIHGVEKKITVDGTVIIKGKEIDIASAFKIHVADYGIKVPSLYIKNIAEDVDVKIDAVLLPFKKK